jgi:hypothetical protein
MNPLAIAGGALGAVGSIFSAAKKKKALAQQQKELAAQRRAALAEQKNIMSQYQEGISGVRGILEGAPTLTAEQLGTLDLSGARGMYGGLAGEARAQQSGLLSAAQQYSQDITGKAQELGQEQLSAARMREALASGGRVQGEELARDAARQTQAETIAQARRVGGGGSALLGAIAQSQGQTQAAQRAISQQYGAMAQQERAAARAGVAGAQQAAGQMEFGAMQSGGQAVLQAGQVGGQQVLSALGQQAGAEGQLTQAEFNAMRAAEMAQYESELGRAQRLANLGLTETGQVSQFQLGAQQLGLDFQQQMNQAQLQQQSTSILGAGLGALGQGLMGAAQLQSQDKLAAAMLGKG